MVVQPDKKDKEIVTIRIFFGVVLQKSTVIILFLAYLIIIIGVKDMAIKKAWFNSIFKA